MSNSDWIANFPSSWCKYLNFEASDHRPVITYIAPKRRKGGKLFRFDRQLNYNSEVKKIVELIWSEQNTGSLAGNLAKCRRAIAEWSQKNRKNGQQEIEKAKAALEKAMADPQQTEATLQMLRLELDAAYKVEEAFWMQKSRQQWLNLGDKNTAYFHAATKGRRAVNRLSTLDKENGESVHEESDIAGLVAEFYNNLFQSSNPPNFGTVEKALSPRIS